MEATLPVFFPTATGRPFGWQDPDEWDAYAAWMREQELITRPEPGSRAMTNEFLPGEGLDPGAPGVSSPVAAASRRYSPARPFHAP